MSMPFTARSVPADVRYRTARQYDHLCRRDQCLCGFLRDIQPAPDYRFWVVVSTLLTTIVSTFGLDTLLRVTIPVLLLIYPTTVALVFLQFARRKMRNPRFTYGFTVAVLVVMSAFDTLNNIGLLSENVLAVLHRMPLFKEGIGWLLRA